MRIQQINNLQTFKGIFEDHSKENGGDWKMVYRPYSWELLDSKTPTMAPKERIDITADYLPDNEEIYTPINGKNPETSKDILGTVSYYRYPESYNLGETRRQIIQGEPLSREESLKVYLNKLEEFKKLKYPARDEIAKEMPSLGYRLSEISFNFYQSSQAYDKALLGYNAHKRDMVEKEKKLYETATKVHEDAMKYIKITSSLQSIEKQKKDIEDELATIDDARNNNNLIDISKRNVPDPNKPYWQAVVETLKDVEMILNTKKVVVFPHKTRTLKSLLDEHFKRWGISPYFDKYAFNWIPDKMMKELDDAIYYLRRCK